MIAEAGEIWLADRAGETRQLVYVVSDSRVHRLAERAVVAPVIDELPAVPRPWHVPVGDRVVLAHQFGSLPIERLLDFVERPDATTLRLVRRAVREFIS